MTKVAHLISSRGLYGAEKMVLQLGRLFNQNGHHTHMGIIRDEREPHEEVITEAMKQGLQTFSIDSKGKVDWQSVTQLQEYLINNGINILHTHNYKSDTIGLFAAKNVKVPIVATVHGYTDMTQSVSLYEKFDRWLLKRYFNHVVVVADNILRDVPQQKRSIIHNGVNVNKFQSDHALRKKWRKAWDLKDDVLAIATIGRFSKEKNQALFLKAGAALITKYPATKLIMIGDGPEDENLKRLAKTLNIENKVVFTGFIKEIESVYQALEVFTLTSTTEGIPVTILEAMAAQVPVIATRVGGIPELIQNNQTGWLIESDKSQQWVSQVEEIINNKAKAQRITAKAYQFIKENFSEKAMQDKYQHVYNEVLN